MSLKFQFSLQAAASRAPPEPAWHKHDHKCRRTDKQRGRSCPLPFTVSPTFLRGVRQTRPPAFFWLIQNHRGNTCTQLGLQTQTRTAGFRGRKTLSGTTPSSPSVCVTVRHKHTIHYISRPIGTYQAAACTAWTGNPPHASLFLTGISPNWVM